MIRKEKMHTIPTRTLGRTGLKPTIFGLGGEGVLRTTDRLADAQAVIRKALDVGVTYFDTAPAYLQSRDYLGSVFKELGSAREGIIIASKTHDPTYEGSMALLDDTLKRLNTDYLDIWQLHDLRTPEDLKNVFAPNGAVKALEEAKQSGKVRFAGITGHHDPDVLIAAIKKYNFDTLLVCVNAGDPHYLPFISTVIPEARKKKMGVIGMKVTAAGQGLASMTMKEAMNYSLTQDVDLCIIGCKTPHEVEMNAGLASEFKPLNPAELKAIEAKTAWGRMEWNYFKKGMMY